MLYKPFLRWAGGKRWLIPKLLELIPDDFTVYQESFLGSGALFFALFSKYGNTKKYILSDLNADLINLYTILRDNSEDLFKVLRDYRNTEKDYYIIRNKKHDNNIEQAAQFFYLNRTSFNGIYRVNKFGMYNVPYGHKEYQNLFDYSLLESCSFALSKVSLKTCDFTKAYRNAKKKLTYLDPPYTVAHENNGFIKYNQKIFSWEDQKRLAKYLQTIREKNDYYILSNAYHESTIDLFKPFGEIIIADRYSLIGGSLANRNKINEIIITNINSRR